MSPKVAIIDYGMGNLQSVYRRLYLAGAQPVVTSDSKEIEEADKIILPGVGHFGKAMHHIHSLGLYDVLNERVLQKKVPILGICLGMQLMAKRSEEGGAEGFGWIDAEVVKFSVQDTLMYKIPQTGWNTIEIHKESQLLQGISTGSAFYFLHAYHMKGIRDENLLATTSYEESFPSAIEEGNILGTQFHPEKSHDAGVQLIKNFLAI